MKMNRSFFVKTFFILISVAASATFTGAQSARGEIYDYVKSAADILTVEIKRDRELIKPAMWGNQLRKVRKRLVKDLKDKEPLGERLKKYKRPALDQAIKIFISTAEAERKLTKGKTVSFRLRHQAYYTLRDNIPRKETALNIFKNWLGN
ncbi:hypothetical protein MNBD_NITROSPINAE04-2729 [hydrothermal vent metagenome]|uniref:Uncharacterized protein n=1 Tax=hydrothermal vent metagenome TaxID=652676 RepID=A0A3B1CGH6_9ZZZZ